MKTFVDSHVHVQPWRMMKPAIVERMKQNRKDMDIILKVMDSSSEFLKHMDSEGVEAAALINYVSPYIMGFTEDVNEFISDFCKDTPARLIPFGSINPQIKTGQESRFVELKFTLHIRLCIRMIILTEMNL
jgi:hypothetical protein